MGISFVIEAGEEACKGMVFIYVCLCLRKKNMHLTELQVKLVYGYKSIFCFRRSERNDKLGFFFVSVNASIPYICN